MKYILVTGAAGFIGFHLVKELQKNKNYLIVGIDNMNNYYDVELKKTRVSILQRKKNFVFYKIDITDLYNLKKIFKKYKLQYVVNLAAQAGVRYSIEKPATYFKSNLEGFFNIINLSKDYGIKHFVFASTSSVYGNQTKFPIEENRDTDKPLSFYAATKKSNEVIAHSFSNIYDLPSTGLRFFTVYGPYGRPDMALFKFSKNIINNKSIKLFNYGDHERDFTFITDIVEGIIKIISKPPKKKIPYEIFNIGGNKSYKLKHFISIIENNLKTKAKFEYLPLQKGDVRKTHANKKKLDVLINKKSYIKLEFGIKKFIKWFNNTYESK
jgi:UDP-glucuronate 4-epimerase